MPQFTILVAFVLIALGLGGYFGTGQTSVTALIPAFFGLAIGLSGMLATKQEMRKHAMHAAVTLALLGLIGSAWRALPILFDKAAEVGVAVYMQLAMAAVCIVFVIFCVRSFIAARKSQA